MNEELWEAGESAVYSEDPQMSSKGGTFEERGKEFHWTLNVGDLAAVQDVYLVRLVVEWVEGNHPVSVLREVYVAKSKPVP